MIHLEKNNLDELVKDGLHLVDFFATWCGPCKMLGPILEEIDSEIDIIKVDIDEFEDLASSYGIMSVPTLLFFKDGEVVREEVGFHSKDDLVEIINEIKKG